MSSSAPVVSASVASALLFSNDPATIGQIAESLRQLAISVEVRTEAGVALRMLSERKFEAVIVDFQLGLEAEVVLRKAHLSPSNRTAVTFAITHQDEVAVARRAGSGFVLERPLTFDSISRTVRASYGLIIRERRRYFRCPIVIPAVLRQHAAPEIHCHTVNISEGGVAVNTPTPLQPGVRTIISFDLPGLKSRFETESIICWYKEPDRAGLQYLSLLLAQLSELQGWLSSKIEESLPKSVMEKFQPGENR